MNPIWDHKLATKRMRTSRDNYNFGRSLSRFILLILLCGLLYYLGREGLAFLAVKDNLPTGTTIAEIDLSGKTADEAREILSSRFNTPVMAMYHDEAVEILPADVGFTMNIDGMINEAISERDKIPYWQRYVSFILKEPLQPIRVRLKASHDPTAVRDLLQVVANLLDRPATQPQLLTNSGFIQMGESGYTADIEASAQRIEVALYHPTRRSVQMVVQDQPAPSLSMEFLKKHLEQQLEGFNGIGSLYILDLSTGEDISINADIAVSGLSIVKIAIMTEMFRAVDGQLNSDQKKLLDQTAIFSGNYSANLLLDIVAGQDNAYLGVDILTQSMNKLGLENTFIATPYEERPRPERQTYFTPANQRSDVNLDPDPAMQTTAEDMGQLLAMLYYCAQGGGTLIAAYPDQITSDECKLLLDTMTLNTEGNLIRFGVPEDVPVAHKHGWAYNTHGDAGIVFSPGGDYVIVQYLHQDSDWLNAGESFPLLRELSRSVYNYFNVDNPYVDHKRGQKAAGKEAINIVAEQIELGTLPEVETVPPAENDGTVEEVGN